MVKRESHHSIVRKLLIDTVKDRSKIDEKVLPGFPANRVFYDLLNFRRVFRSKMRIALFESQPEPHVKEIRKFRVIYISHVWWIGNYMCERVRGNCCCVCC